MKFAGGAHTWPGASPPLFVSSEASGTNEASFGGPESEFDAAAHDPHVLQAPCPFSPARRILAPRRKRNHAAPATAISATISCQSNVGTIQLHKRPMRYAAKAPIYARVVM
jgi:hypothetical protein